MVCVTKSNIWELGKAVIYYDSSSHRTIKFLDHLHVAEREHAYIGEVSSLFTCGSGVAHFSYYTLCRLDSRINNPSIKGGFISFRVHNAGSGDHVLIF